MKKRTIMILSIIILVLSFIFAEIFSIYHFGNVPTLLTSLYLISIFVIFEYLSISITYIVKKLIKKEKNRQKKIKRRKVRNQKNYRVNFITCSIIINIIIFSCIGY